MSKKTTRRTIRKAKTARPTSPAERMAKIIKMMNEHYTTQPANPLTHRNTPLEALKACQELTRWQFDQTFQRDGSQHVWLMLTHALGHIEKELLPLFDCAMEIAKGGSK